MCIHGDEYVNGESGDGPAYHMGGLQIVHVCMGVSTQVGRGIPVQMATDQVGGWLHVNGYQVGRWLCADGLAYV